MPLSRHRSAAHLVAGALIVLGGVAAAWVIYEDVGLGLLFHAFFPQSTRIFGVYLLFCHAWPAILVASAWTWRSAAGSLLRVRLTQIVAGLLLLTAMLSLWWFCDDLTRTMEGLAYGFGVAGLPAGLWLISAMRRSRPAKREV